MNNYNIEWYDVSRLLQFFGYKSNEADIIADYLDNCTTDYDLTNWIWNVLPYNVQIFDTKKEALEYIDEELDSSHEECTLYVSDFGGVILERY